MSRPSLHVRNLYRASLLELPIQGEQSPADEYREIAERWKNQAALEGHSVAEKYAAGRLALVCDLNVSLASGDADGPKAVRSGCQFTEEERFARLVFNADVPDVLEMDLGDEEFVLVQNVQCVKLPDGLSIPSFVRLYHVQDEVADPLGGLMFESSIDGVLHFLPGVVNRKLRELGSLPSGSELNVAGRIVQGGSQIMDRIPDNAHHPFRNALEWNDVEGIAASLGIVLDGDFIRVGSLEGSKFRVKFQDVLFGPFDF
ncbi:MAG: hypothetical protein WA419_07645 [Silvibacterium sp.]